MNQKAYMHICDDIISQSVFIINQNCISNQICQNPTLTHAAKQELRNLDCSLVHHLFSTSSLTTWCFLQAKCSSNYPIHPSSTWEVQSSRDTNYYLEYKTVWWMR